MDLSLASLASLAADSLNSLAISLRLPAALWDCCCCWGCTWISMTTILEHSEAHIFAKTIDSIKHFFYILHEKKMKKVKNHQNLISKVNFLMSGSCHLNRALNVKIGFQWQIFVIVFFYCSRALQFWAHLRHCKGALTQKKWFVVICTTFRSAFRVGWKNQNKHSTLNLSFHSLSKWHEPDISAFNLHLLEFTFVYQFNSRETNLVESTFRNPVELFAFMSFHNNLKLFWYCVLLNMRGIFCPYLFWGTAKWHLNW